MEKWEHLKIPFENIKEATKDFEKLIGKGGYGEVYEGQLLINGMLTMVAVKRLNEQFGQGLKEFLTEIDLLSGQHHEKLITLVGYCDQGKEKIIVYEYAQHGSLDRYIKHSDTNPNRTLPWLERLRIVVGAARGLDHLHNHLQKNHVIIHRDIKCSNILLDHKWVAKISDLGLSKSTFSGSDRSAVISHACGTLGYVEPEYTQYGIVTRKSDVYSFGMVLFEVLCGRLLPAEVTKEHYVNDKMDQLIDPDLMEQMRRNSLGNFSSIAYKCLQARENRPLMDVVKKELEKTLAIQLGMQIQDKEVNSSFRAITPSLQKDSVVIREKLRELLSFCSKPVELDQLLDGLTVYHPPTLVPPVVISMLHDMALQMLQTGQQEQVFSIYREARSSCMEANLRALGVEMHVKSDFRKLKWDVLKDRIEHWVLSMRIGVKMLFVAERKVSDQVFEGMESFLDRCFVDATSSSVSVLLSFGESVAKRKWSPEQLHYLLDMYAIMKEVQPEFNTLYASIFAAELREFFSALTKRFAETAQELVADHVKSLDNEWSDACLPIHPRTNSIVNFLIAHSSALKQLSVEFDPDAQPAKITIRILQALHNNLERSVNDDAFGHVFMMNNLHYIVTSLQRYEEMKNMLGDEWIQNHLKLVQRHANQYKRISFSKILQCLEDVSCQWLLPDMISRAMIRSRLKTFNSQFEVLHQRHSLWTVRDAELRKSVRLAIAELLLPTYRTFCLRVRRLFMGREDVLRYTQEDLERMLADFFKGDR